MVTLALALPTPGFLVADEGNGLRTAEAATIKIAEREMKKSKDYEESDIYQRAHSIIWKGQKAHDDRPRIAVIINGDENFVVENRVKNQIYSQLRRKFPSDEFAVMKGTDVNTRLLEAAEARYYEERGNATVTTPEPAKKLYGQDNGVVSNIVNGVGDFLFGGRKELYNYNGDRHWEHTQKQEKLDVDGMPVPNRPRGLADMRKEDYAQVGRELGYDYVFVFTMSNGKAENEKHNFVVFNSVTNHKNVWLRLKFIDTANNTYLYRNDIAAQGEAHNGSFGGKILERSVEKAMQEAMDDLTVEL